MNTPEPTTGALTGDERERVENIVIFGASRERAVEEVNAILAAHTQPTPEAHIVHVTAEPVAEDVVWCDQCEEWVTSGTSEPALDGPSFGDYWPPDTSVEKDENR